MKIALVADIHSNHMAFEAVLKDISNRQVDKIIFLGDYIFGGYGSNETVDLLMDYNADNQKHVIISGNIDELIEPIEENAEWIYPINRFIYSQLGSERVAFLKSLPREALIEEQGISVCICHNPSNIEVFTMNDNIRRENNIPNRSGLAEIASGMNSDVCIFGHYHLFMDEEINGKRFICPSSVGMPFNGEPKAQYMILEIKEGKISNTKHYVDYDRLKMIEELDEKGYFEKFGGWAKDIVATILTGHNYMG